MRARDFRPKFDRLDTRLFLTGDGSTLITGANVGSSVTAMYNITVDGSPRIDLVTLLDWYGPGSPPPDTYDPSTMATPWELLPQGN